MNGASIYLDNNATTPCDPRVLDAMLPYFTQKFGNAASSTHSFGWIAKEAVDLAREQVARLINAEPTEIIFTSGATEADNLALKGVFEMYAGKGNHIITCVTEHKAVLDSCKHIERLGGEITYLPVDKNGLINLQQLEDSITEKTVLIAIMYGNNETGTIQPVQQISNIARKHNVLFFTDATQAVGKIRVDVQADGIDIMAFSAHKMYGPKGVGALYVRRKDPRVRLMAQIDGGGHERGMRSGTMNVPGIVGLGKACAICYDELETEQKHLSAMRNKLETVLLELGGASVNGSVKYRLPHVANISFKGVSSNALIGCNKNIALSSGSACNSASFEASHVLKALGLSSERIEGSIRFALGRFTTEEEIEQTIAAIKRAVTELRLLNPEWATDKQYQLK
ncbi:MAG: aminotransferase class V-fold PLP-dependent enzyme [Sphingobacteriales bacterium]|nr:MAG: aminotransferase class V-fold PLP-dependent enzyme [Sphingobacteriales bacterium]